MDGFGKKSGAQGKTRRLRAEEPKYQRCPVPEPPDREERGGGKEKKGKTTDTDGKENAPERCRQNASGNGGGNDHRKINNGNPAGAPRKLPIEGLIGEKEKARKTTVNTQVKIRGFHKRRFCEAKG